MMQPHNHSFFFFLILLLFFFLLFYVHPTTTTEHEHDTTTTTRSSNSSTSSSIAFATVGRSSYAFDIFSISLWDPPTSKSGAGAGAELQITDGTSVNFNGHFPSSVSIFSDHFNDSSSSSNPPPIHVIYVSERNGSSSIYLDTLLSGSKWSILDRVQLLLLGGSGIGSDQRVSMKDRPSLVGDSLIYVSTHQDSGVPRQSWAAVYSTHLKTGFTLRLTPKGMADFSPAVSPSGLWTAVASSGDNPWNGEVDELATDIYVFLTSDGSRRTKIVDHGGWPTWLDDSTLYFHRRCEDGWWSVFKASLQKNGVVVSVTQRVTPPGLHAFTPAASQTNNRSIVVATRRETSEFRHIESFDIVLGEFKEITRPLSPNAHHYNPFISPDGSRVGYHRCRGLIDVGNNNLILEYIHQPIPAISLFRIAGSFPSFSPDGSRIAYVNFPGLYVMNSDGSGLRKVYSETAFTTAWDPKRKGVVYTSIGPTFASETTNVDIISVNVDDEDLSYRKLTSGGENNAFPSPSPDGKLVVFRSGRSGHKNLYIMDALNGETGGLRRLTNGPWTDTMCNWSPDGNWIVFASDRENPGAGSFAVYMVHSDGTGIHKVVESGSGGRTNHPWFSPDGKYIVFTSDYGGVSAEPISNPHHFQPYGDIFITRVDGSSGIKRLTHNSYEDGTPTWGPNHKLLKPVDVEFPGDGGPHCSFDDCHWLAT